MIWLLAAGGVALLVAVVGAVIVSGDEVEDPELEVEDRRAERFEAMAEAFLRLRDELGREPTTLEMWTALDSSGDDEQAVVVDLRDRVAAVAEEFEEWRRLGNPSQAEGRG